MIYLINSISRRKVMQMRKYMLRTQKAFENDR